MERKCATLGRIIQIVAKAGRKRRSAIMKSWMISKSCVQPDRSAPRAKNASMIPILACAFALMDTILYMNSRSGGSEVARLEAMGEVSDSVDGHKRYQHIYNLFSLDS